MRERAVRMVFEHQGEFDSKSAAIKSIASKIGCGPILWKNNVLQAQKVGF